MPFKKTILSAALLKVIEKEVDKLYDKAIVRYLGPWALDKVIFFGSKKEQEKWEKENVKPFMTLPGLITASALQNGGQPSEELTEQLIDNVKEYFDAYRAQTKAQVRARVQNFVREAAISGKEVNPKVVLGGQLTDVWKGATAQAKRLVDTESTTARNLGGLEAVVEVSKKQGIDDPTVAFLSIKDKYRCGECTRLHTLDDGVTPRVWKLSEVGHGYHKKGQQEPKIGGLHPNCLTGSQRIHTSRGALTVKELFEQGGALEVVVDSRVKPRRIGNNQFGAEIPGSTWFNRHASGAMLRAATNVYDTGVQECYRIELDSGHVIEVSAGHEMWVDDNKNGKKVEARNLQVGDKVPLLSGETGAWGRDSFPVYAELMGNLMGGGHIGETSAQWSFFGDDIPYGNELLRKARSVVPATSRYHLQSELIVHSPNDKYNVESAQFNSTALRNIFVEEFALSKKPRRVPSRIWGADRETASAFLRGLYAADGHSESTPAVVLAQNDLDFLREIQVLLSMFGFVSRIYTHGDDGLTKTMTYANGDKHEVTRGACWRLHIGGALQVERFAKEIGFGVPRKQQDLLNRSAQATRNPIRNNWRTAKVKFIESIGAQQTYCLTEPVTNTITVNGIVTGQCRCTMVSVEAGYGFDSSGKIVYKGENWNEFKHQRGLEKSISYEHHDCDTLEKVSPAPNFKKLGVEPREIPVIETETQARSKAATVANAGHFSSADSWIPPEKRTTEGEQLVRDDANRIAENTVIGGNPNVRGMVGGSGQGGYVLGKNFFRYGINDKDIEGTKQHESFHATLNRIQDIHGSQARKNLVNNLFWAVPKQLIPDVARLYQLAVPASTIESQDLHVAREEALAYVLNHVNSPLARLSFHAKMRAAKPEHNSREFDSRIKQAHKAIRAIAEVADESWLTDRKGLRKSIRSLSEIGDGARRGAVTKAEKLDKMAISDLGPGKAVNHDTDYSHLLPEDYRNQGYSLIAEGTNRDPGVRPTSFIAKSPSGDYHGQIGIQPTNDDTGFEVTHSTVSPGHRRKGLGTSLYEAAFKHASSVWGRTRVTASADGVSKAAFAVHQKLAAKHGLEYSFTPGTNKYDRDYEGVIKAETDLQKSDRKTSDYIAELARYGWEPTGRSSKHITLTNRLFPATRPLAISHSEAKRISVNNMENNAKSAGLIWDYSGMKPDPKHPYAEHYIKHGLLELAPDAPKTWRPKDHDGQLMEIDKVLSLKPDVHLDWRTAKHLSTFKTTEDHSSIAPIKVMDGGDGNFYAEEGDEQLEAARAHGFTHVPVTFSEETIKKAESELLAKMALIHDDETNPVTVYRVQRADGMGPYNNTYTLGLGGDREKETKWFNLPVPGKDRNFTTTPTPTDDFMPNEFGQLSGRGDSPLRFAFEKPEHAEDWFGRDWLEGAKEFGFEVAPVKAKKVYRSLSGRQLMYIPHEEPVQKALSDIPVGRREDEDEDDYDYSHILTPEHRAEGYGLLVSHSAGALTAHLTHNNIVHGTLSSTVFGGNEDWGEPGYIKIGDANLRPQHRSKGLGSAMYEAVLAHGVNTHGVKLVRGGTHSADAEAVHRRLATKHGLTFQPTPENDGMHPPYEYALKEEKKPTKKRAQKLAKSTPKGLATLEYIRDSAKRHHEKYKKHYETHNKNYSWLSYGGEEIPLSPEAIEAVKEMLRRSPVVVHLPHGNLDLIAEDGRLKNRFETGTSQGSLDEELRATWEANLGIPADAGPDERPIYGALHYSHGDDTNKDGAARMYGNVWLELHPHVKERTSFTRGDSSGVIPGQVYTDIDMLADHALNSVPWEDDRYDDDNSEMAGNLAFIATKGKEGKRPPWGGPYFEAQVHGGIDLKRDVSSVNVSINSALYTPSSRQEITESAVSFGKKFGVPVHIHDGHTNETVTKYDPNEKPATPEMEQPAGDEKKVG